MSNIIALFGRRQVGKSHIANHLVDTHGYVRLHPFNPGKAGLREVYKAGGANDLEALRMTDTDLKDLPSRFLPKIGDDAHLMMDPSLFSKTFARGYLEYMGIPSAEVEEMISGEGSDVPDARIPENASPRDLLSTIETFAREDLWDVNDKIPFKSPKTKSLSDHPEAAPGHYTSRYVMEKLGHFMGVRMGSEWTLNAEIQRSLRMDGEGKGKVIESIVYEIKDLPDVENVFVVRVSSDDEKPIESAESDAFISTIEEDAHFHNPMRGLDELGWAFDKSMGSQGITVSHAQDIAPAPEMG